MSKTEVNSTKETTMDDRTELLARMWIMCDPNRQPDSADEPIQMETADGKPAGTLNGKPRWHWFIPRAVASLEFMDAHGYELVKKG